MVGTITIKNARRGWVLYSGAYINDFQRGIEAVPVSYLFTVIRLDFLSSFRHEEY